MWYYHIILFDKAFTTKYFFVDLLISMYKIFMYKK